MKHEQPAAPEHITGLPIEAPTPEVGELSYTELSLFRNVVSRLPHPLRRVNAAVGEFLDGMGAI